MESGFKSFNCEPRAFVFGSNSLEWLLSFSPCNWSVMCMAQGSLLGILATKVCCRMKIDVSEQQDWATRSKSCDALLGAGTASSTSIILAALAVGVPATMFALWCKTRALWALPAGALHHHAVGGATSSSRRLWTRDWSHTGLPQVVSRLIGHLLDHSTLHAVFSREPSFAHLKPKDLLPVTRPLLPVVFPTHATLTQWGSRELTSKEVTLCLDAPLWIVSNPTLLALFVQRHAQRRAIPLKLLQAPLQACLALLDPSPPAMVAPGPSSFQLILGGLGHPCSENGSRPLGLLLRW